jgi:hypothetical protein
MLSEHLRISMAAALRGRQEIDRKPSATIPSFGGTPRERHVKWTELLESWRHGASGTRTVSHYAVHLPLEDAARLQALTEMFPDRSAEQIITDLLGVALREIAAAMPYIPGSKVIATDEQGDPIYEDTGPTPRFMELTRRNQKKLKSESNKG